MTQLTEEQDLKRDNLSIPWSAWTSLWSLDAVAVAVVWQTLAIQCFLDRWPTIPETFALAATVWLIYVADRLLDASRLDLSRPHTLRHRFYHRHATAYRWMWASVLILTTGVVITQLPSSLIRAGILLATAVLVYGAGVHFIPTRSQRGQQRERWVSKETQVGVLFAIGVTLVSWSETARDGSIGVLAVMTVFLAIAFGFNCRLVSQWEANVDRSQSFNQGGLISIGPITHWQATLGLITVPVIGITMAVPVALWVCLLVSVLGLFMVARFSDLGCTKVLKMGCTEFDCRGPLVDAALWIPPAVSILMTAFWQ